MHSKENIRTILNNTTILERIIKSLPVSIEHTRDLINLSVWGILNEQDKENLLKLLDYYNNSDSSDESISPDLLREIKKVGIKIVRFIDSIGTYRKNYLKKGEKNELLFKMRNPGIALEYFLIDMISRLYEQDKKTRIEKGPNELESNKIDFILDSHNIKFGIQLTLSEGSSISSKKRDLYKERENINNGIVNNGVSNNFSSDVPVFMIINSKTSKQAYHNNILLIAFQNWMNDGFPMGGPSIYLEKPIQKELKKIGFTLPKTLEKTISFIKEIYINGDKNKYQEQQINNMHLVYDGEKLKVSIFSKEKYGLNKTNFVYSVEIFITEKLIEKLIKNKEEI
ncbi:hypothetical protein EOM39_05060 [Candidatus Gracilibacteria bacterium]|nr:hypothetical protein [Candidatus Gracilibacteria bacterium]